MIVGIVAAALFLQTPAPAKTAGQIVSSMLLRYSSAKTITGTVAMQQSAMNTTISVDNEFAIERSDHIYLRQQRRSSDPRTVVLICDGKTFSYDLPEEREFNKRQFERVVVREFDAIFEAYRASLASLVDRSPVIDIVVGTKPLLEDLRDQWASLKLKGETKYRGVSCEVVGGNWRSNANRRATGTYEMIIGPEGDLYRYSVTQVIAVQVPSGGNQGGKPESSNIEVLTSWDVTAKVNTPIDPKVFTVR